jgi:Spy/CpxP family protein refolding chaperone
MQNTSFKRFLAAAVLALAIPASSFAAPDNDGPDMPPPPGMGMGMGMMDRGFGPHEHEGMRLERLGLTEAQQDKLFDLRHAQEPALRAAQKDVMKARRALHEAASSDTYDATRVAALADQLGRAEAAMAKLHAEGMHQFREVLTPDQRRKLDERRGPRNPA